MLHIKPDGDEWVVFCSHQIIPVCLLHIQPLDGVLLPF